jgi:hypothetical protein
MPEKLDPMLRDLVERADVRPAAVDVLVALDAPLDSRSRRDLAERGLTVRSDVGTIVTGSIELGDVGRLAESEQVVKVEAAAPLFPENPAMEGDGNWTETGE